MTGAMARLLVAYDGSTGARAALRRAADLAHDDDEVSVLNVMPEPGVSSRIGLFVEERRHQAALLQEAAQFLERRGIGAHCIVSVGSAAAETLAAAERLEADLIVVAGERRRLIRVLGSPSERIARKASCDVLVVHDTEH